MELRILPSNIYKVSSAYIIVLSYDNQESFEMLKNWIEHIKQYITTNFRTNTLLIPILVMVNKADIKKERKFKLSEVMKVVDEFDLNIVVYEISAKENTKVDYVFEKIIGFLSCRHSLSNENSQNTTNDGGLSVNDYRSRKRTKSFQLKNEDFYEMGYSFDKNMKKQSSCC